MGNIFKEILDWSEAWAPLIPLTAAVIYKPKPNWTKPVIGFLVLALLINLLSDIIWKRYGLGIAGWMYESFPGLYDAPALWTDPDIPQISNVLLYNIHAILRYLFFAWFFHYLSPVFRKMNRVLIPLFVVALLVIFTQYKDIRDFSSLLMGTDSAILLIYCLIYYFLMLKDEESDIRKQPHFWVVLGLSIYVVINFPIFLFYSAAAKQAQKFAIDIWGLHNLTYIIFCIFLAKAFYSVRSKKVTL